MNRSYTHQLTIQRRHPLQLLCLTLLITFQGWSGTLTAQHLASLQRSTREESFAHKPAATISLAEALKELEHRYRVTFLYRQDVVSGKTVLLAPTKGKSLVHQIERLLKPFQLKYRRMNENYFVILPHQADQKGTVSESKSALPSPEQELLSTQRLAQEVRGTVTNETGEGLPGVSVLLKGTTTGTATNGDGTYALSLPDNGGTLVFSFIGYVTEEVPVGAQTVIDVKLLPDIKSLSEVVVVGYGTQQKRDVTGSVSAVSEKEIKAVPVTGVDQALQGRAAGVEVIQNNGAPGGSVSIRVRGVGTIGNTEPLYVIDGVPTVNANDGSNSNVLNTINPNDIVSVDVLKDASATAIYGARGANGVVMITTKRGKAGRTNINFDSYYGVQQVAKKVDLLNASEFAALNNDILINGGLKPNNKDSVGADATSPDYSNPAALGEGTDWLKEIFRTAPIQNYNLSISGGNEKTQFALSGGYFRQEGIILNSNFKRYSLRLNLDHQISQRIKVGHSMSLSRTEQRTVTTDEDTRSGLVFLAMNQLPTLPVYRNGTYAGPEGKLPFVGDKSNPVGRANTLENFVNRNRLLGSVFGEWEIINGLKFRTNLGLDAIFRDNSNFEPTYQWGSIRNSPAQLNKSNAQDLTWLAENTFTYSKTFERHSLTALAGIAAQSFSNQFLSAGDRAYPYNNIQSLQVGSGTYSANSLKTEWALFSYIGRVNYAYADKYLLTATIRRDGSSRFGPNNRYGVFPSASVAWRVSNEEFMKGLSAVNDLKLRASYGQTGNQENGGLYGYTTLLSGLERYVLSDNIRSGVAPTTLANANIQWETVTQTDFGLDLGLFQNRLLLTADIYRKITTDMLLVPPIAPSTGYRGSAAVNAGKVQNDGLELGLNSQNVTGGDFTWNTNANVSFIRNRVRDLAFGRPISGGGIDFNQTITRTEVGQPIGSFFGYVTDGIFQTADEVRNHAVQQPGTAPGDIRFRDLNNDGTINDDDRTFIGSPIPKFTFGLTNNFTYRNFDLSIFLYGAYGNKIFNANRIFNEQMSGAFNQTTETLNRWRSPAEPGNGKMPRAVWDDPNINARTSDRYVEDGSYLRIKNLTLGYKLPTAVLNTLKVQQIRVYVSAQNLHTFTKYKGFDPEVGPYQQGNLQSGVNNGTYPVARTFIFGLNVGL